MTVNELIAALTALEHPDTEVLIEQEGVARPVKTVSIYDGNIILDAD